MGILPQKGNTQSPEGLALLIGMSCYFACNFGATTLPSDIALLFTFPLYIWGFVPTLTSTFQFSVIYMQSILQAYTISMIQLSIYDLYRSFLFELCPVISKFLTHEFFYTRVPRPYSSRNSFPSNYYYYCMLQKRKVLFDVIFEQRK